MTDLPRHGFLAVTAREGVELRSTSPFLAIGEGTRAECHDAGSVATTSWGLLPPRPGDPAAGLLCSVARCHDADQTRAQVHRLLSTHSSELAGLMPTFAAATWCGDDVLAAAVDALGFRHLYLTTGSDWCGLSTSAHLLAADEDARLDQEALAVQSRLGWQLAQRTVFAGVEKVARGALVELSRGRAHTEVVIPQADEPALPLDMAVADAARMLRRYLTVFLDDHPDAILQLTGGLDSRILLSAIPVERRRGLRIVTLSVPGVEDLAIASDLAHRFGMKHEVLTLEGLDELDRADAYRRCVDAAIQLDCSADPLAHASLYFAESRAEEGPRLSGLGGEVARGFYYHGIRTDEHAAVTRARSRRLAAWRMFANASAESEALAPDFAPWADQVANDAVYRALADAGRPWFAATDNLYLAHRMQRWAGITETAVCMDRRIVNPMLDERFVSIARRLRPVDKRNARFLSRLVVALDPDLAALPMDGRPAPTAYARRTLRGSAGLSTAYLSKYRHKTLQRVRHVNLPPAGGEILARKVVDHWRAEPSLLEPLAGTGIFESSWLERVVERRADPRSSTVAFMLNVLVAASALSGSPVPSPRQVASGPA